MALLTHSSLSSATMGYASSQDTPQRSIICWNPHVASSPVVGSEGPEARHSVAPLRGLATPPPVGMRGVRAGVGCRSSVAGGAPRLAWPTGRFATPYTRLHPLLIPLSLGVKRAKRGMGGYAGAERFPMPLRSSSHP